MGWGRRRTGATDVRVDRDTASLHDALINALFVLSVPKMNLEILDCHAGTRGVEFSRAVVATDTRQILIFDFLAWLDVVRVGHRGHGFHVHGGIAHHAFKRVIGVGLL